ncbi:lipopolysaccharide transport periplasmic protein LptA [Pasteurella skyensis]|uniref:Lipopolysaccharide export system protein LptA n=1 Tax=Phocoenobacter skyensis TaxID=97481 RepID=A0AAJ6P0Y1_9PAST|nr:lipopolysaccharide transport periplasmic protein LptA [Pasteurella skyensis]MDP8163035.1 lipopolysaccharide transport periplasmic protein LptA [Pasteurella skyensis]MDP8173104.1 lipopolysaccharide transport periplasmic protein LptA [Pasteurella skyensis]MDP8176327.1 lipopolysaccharide transport periplasmic protein LptA [Pasteurella skyensis]MDP8178963.1 lipopolysaccharide transport periplasmic protein LptA [Pasteurella skyensis]MDP8183732.1 lipopolysaccharide transport periplasmic protein L
MNFILRFFILTILLVINVPVYALNSDTEQPIDIESTSQSFDMETNTITLNGNVVITQGTIKITAEKVIVVRHENKSEVMTAYGSPVKFYQMLESGKPVNGQASKMHYDLGSEFITLTGAAQLEQLDSSVKANKITYDVKKQQLKALRDGKMSRVKTTLIPTQLNK